MRRSALFATLIAAAALVASGAEAHPARSLTERNRAIVTDFAHRFYDLRDVRGAFERHVASDYVQHNPGIADGREAAIRALEPLFGQPGARFEVKRIIVDGAFALIHLRGRSSPNEPGGAVADIYRLKDGRIVEHWDALQPIQSSTVNPHPYF